MTRKTSNTVANPELAAAMRELRRSSAASPHVMKSRKGTRASRERHAIADSMTDTFASQTEG